MRRAWLAAALLCLSLGRPQHGGAAALALPVNRPTGGAATLLENAKQCIFMLQDESRYMWSLQGLASPSGSYTAVQPVGAVTYTFWFQFCGNMVLSRADPTRPGVACSRKGFENNCPKGCRDERTHVCGNGCAAMMAQQQPRHKHSACWSVGQWGDGRKVSISLIDPSDPTQGIVYTMLQGDTKGCPGGISRTFSIAVRCPGVGMPVVPVLNVSSLGNCAYAASMAHPAACPIAPGSLPRKDQRLSYRASGAGYPSYYSGGRPAGSTAQSLGSVAAALVGLFGFYCAVGMAWRFSVLGMRGAEALPHAAVWRDLPNSCVRGIAAAADEVRGLMEGASSGVPDEARDEPRMPLLRRG